MQAINYYLVHMSPNGSTEKVADALAEQLTKGSATVERLDLAGAADYDEFIDKINNDPQACLLIGSPVYRDMAIPPVMKFIEALGTIESGWAVPFVTWGMACSGVALWQMGSALENKGFRLAGAARVGALHSMTWPADEPVGQGRPDDTDMRLVRDLGRRLLAGNFKALSLTALDYQPAERAAEIKAKLEQAWMVIPKEVNADACTECGVCEEVCPVETIHLEPLPVIGDACFDCFNCIRLCPENAIVPGFPLAKIEAMIRERVTTINEQPPTEIYWG